MELIDALHVVDEIGPEIEHVPRVGKRVAIPFAWPSNRTQDEHEAIQILYDKYDSIVLEAHEIIQADHSDYQEQMKLGELIVESSVPHVEYAISITENTGLTYHEAVECRETYLDAKHPNRHEDTDAEAEAIDT